MLPIGEVQCQICFKQTATQLEGILRVSVFYILFILYLRHAFLSFKTLGKKCVTVSHIELHRMINAFANCMHDDIMRECGVAAWRAYLQYNSDYLNANE